MEITYLPKDYIITTTAPSNNENYIYFSDFMLRALRIKNTTSSLMEIQSITYIIRENGGIIKEHVYPYESLQYWIPRWNENIHIKENQIDALIGAKKFWDESWLVKSTVLEPGQEIGLRNEYFHIIYNKVLDELIVMIKYVQNGIEYNKSKKIALIEYKNKNNYIFPVKGNWQINGNFDCITAHRQRNSDEFAFDLCQLDKNGLNIVNKNKKPEDYPHYGKEVYSIADGIVVQVYEEMLENTIGLSEEENKRLESIHGYWPIITGNIIVIQHENGEYSAYDHLQYHSIHLKVGDSVKQGHVIGLVGDTGLSGCPHLHFELKDGNKPESRSLPCSFINITDTNGNKIDIINEEYTIIHAV